MMSVLRNSLVRWCAAVLCGAACLAGPLVVHAEGFPSRPVRLVVGFGPGGLGDIVARSVAQKMSESMGQQVVVLNQPGAGGITAATTVARAAPDGYTLLLVSGQNAFSPSLFKSLPYDPVNSFSMVSTLGRFHFLVVVDKDSPIRNLKDMVETARRDRDRFSLATIAVGSAQHLSARLMLTMSSLEVPIVPFKTTGDVVTALKGQTVQAGVETTTGAINHVKSGNLRAIATSSRQRLTVLPDIPTVSESGLPELATYESDSWNGIVAPAGTPRDVVQRLHSEIAKALASPDIRERFLSLGIEPASSTPEELRQVFINDAAKWGNVIRQANITAQ
jgi:tripartite-type tricarboxylate transporter receptor subunit TctC